MKLCRELYFIVFSQNTILLGLDGILAAAGMFPLACNIYLLMISL